MDKKKGFNFCIEELGFYRIAVSSPKKMVQTLFFFLGFQLQGLP